MSKNVEKILLLFFCVFIFLLSIRGIAGNPKAEELNTPKWRNDGPFEQTGRFALLYSVVEDHSFQFSLPLARFAAPDLAITNNGAYVSLFAPGVSFLAIPGYVIGKYFGIAQVGTFAVISLFAISNIFLIRAIAIKLGISSIAGTIGGLVFAFATPAFPYGVDLYQHHISTFLILFSIFSLLYFSDFVALFVVWFCFVTSIIVDYPNFLMMLPIGIYALTRVFVTKKTGRTLQIEINFLKFLTFSAVIFPLAFFLWFNNMSYGSPFRLSGAMERVMKIDTKGNPLNVKIDKDKTESVQDSFTKQISVLRWFNPRLMINGFYIHFFSPDRGILRYTPVMFFGFVGGAIFIVKKRRFAILFAYIVSLNILIYSMWGDPWGGWAFGSRYLIPSYAILSIFIAYLISILSKKNLFLVVFFAVVSYSVAINTLGALTSSLNPPKIEADVLSREAGYEFKYTYGRNIDFLNNQGSKSYIYNTYMGDFVSPWNYYIDITFFIIAVFAFLLSYNRIRQEL